ncbi:polysaccharide pyruvyl transferase CsaB [Candidatus Margulisiibacteriota bacterium]
MKLLLCGYYGFKNTGDEAILESLINGFRERGNIIDLTVLSNTPQQTAIKFNVKSVSRHNLMRIVFELLKCDGFALGGGGLLQDRTSRRSFLYYAALTGLAQLLNKKTFIIAQGIGPIGSKINRIILKKIIEKSTVVTVREKKSYDLVKALNSPKTMLMETVDPALSLQPKNISSLLKQEGINFNKRPLFGIAVRPYKMWTKVLPRLAEACDLIVKKFNAEIVFIPLQYPGDIAASEKVIDKMQQPAKLIRGDYSAAEILGLIKEMDYLLGMRLHSLIFAAASLVPAIGISYDPKVQAFMDEFSLPWVEQAQLNPDEIVRMFKQLQDNREGVIKSLDFTRKKLYGKTILNFDAVITPMRQR